MVQTSTRYDRYTLIPTGMASHNPNYDHSMHNIVECNSRLKNLQNKDNNMCKVKWFIKAELYDMQGYQQHLCYYYLRGKCVKQNLW